MSKNEIEKYTCQVHHEMIKKNNKVIDELSGDMKDIKRALLGTMDDTESSLIYKVNVLFNERKERRDMNKALIIWLCGCVVSIITMIFFVGATYNQLQSMQEKIKTHTTQIEEIHKKLQFGE